MRILWLAHENNMSGANKCLIEFLEILKGEGFENYLIVPSEGEIAHSARDSVIQIFIVKFYQWIRMPNMPLGPMKLLKKICRNSKAVLEILILIYRIKPDYCITNTVVTPVMALAAVLYPKRHIWVIHEFGEEDHGYRIGRNFKSSSKIMSALSEKLVFVSNSLLKKYMEFIPIDKLSVVSNPVNGSTQVTKNDFFESKILKGIIVAQIAPGKNQVELIRAIQICKQRGLIVELKILGNVVDMVYYHMLLDLIDSMDLGNQISFLGYVQNPSKLIAESHVLFVCSKSEAFGRCTIESLKMGVPVIGSNIGGTAEIILDDGYGLLYSPGNEIDLADKIQLFIKRYQDFNPVHISDRISQRFNIANTKKELLKLFSVDEV